MIISTARAHTLHEATHRLSVRHTISGTLLAACLAAQSSLAQQPTTSLLPDAMVLAPRSLRVRVLSAFTRYDELLGSGPTRNIGSLLAVDSLGPQQVPAFSVAETDIRAASGLSTFRLTAGQVAAVGNARVVTAPLILEFGLTSRITLGVVVPLVETRTTLLSQLNPRLGHANVGPNPALNNPTTLGTNAALVRSLRSAADTLQTRLTSCQANPTAAGCQALLAQQSQAQSLIQTTTTVATALENLYGTDAANHPGQPFVPISSDASQVAINNNIASLRQQYQNLLNSDVVSGSVAPALAPGAQAAFQQLLLAAGRDTIGSIDRSSVGDISVGATFQLLNSYGDTTRVGQYRLAVNAAYRIGTGQPASRSRLFDMSTGYGQPGVVVSGAADVRFTRRVSLTTLGSYTANFGTIDVTHVANAGNLIFPLTDAPGTYSAGNAVSLTVLPRYRLSGYLAVNGQYSLVHTAADQYTVLPLGSTSGETVPTAPFGASASTAQQVGIAVSYSTVSGADRYPGRIPFEASFSHLETISASGGPIPKTFRDQIELRLYVGR